MDDVRWKQRFQNFEKAYLYFKQSLEEPRYEIFPIRERQGVIQQFEWLIELAWKTLRDLLVEGGVEINPVFPKNVFREAFAAGIIEDNEIWAEMIELRNQLSHAYDEEVFENAFKRFKPEFSQPLAKLYIYLKELTQQ